MIPSPPDPRSPIQHRAPILCVDRILAGDAEGASAEHLVQPGPHVDGGSMWESGLIEGLAQTAAVIQGSLGDSGESAAGVGMLVGVRKFHVERRPRVGELVTWRVDVLRRLGPFLLTQGEARVADELIARGEFKFYWEVEA